MPDVGSMTIVEVMPTVGVMSPHGSMPAGTGEARWSDHATAPLAADRAYTVSFWVATKTWPPKMSGSPYTGPSSDGEVHASVGVCSTQAQCCRGKCARSSHRRSATLSRSSASWCPSLDVEEPPSAGLEVLDPGAGPPWASMGPAPHAPAPAASDTVARTRRRDALGVWPGPCAESRRPGGRHASAAGRRRAGLRVMSQSPHRLLLVHRGDRSRPSTGRTTSGTSSTICPSSTCLGGGVRPRWVSTPACRRARAFDSPTCSQSTT